MSLSDYSSDDSLELEEGQFPQMALQGLQKAKMSKTGSKTPDGGPSTMFLGALAALAVAGVAAGSLYMRQHWTGRKQDPKRPVKEGESEPRKDLRRKRGDVKESPRAQPFMARTESASSVGPLRKQPRRDTSEDSGGEASGSSPTASGMHTGKPKVLRKTMSKTRHKRPPVRTPAFETPKEASEGEKADAAHDAKELEQRNEIAAAGSQEEGAGAAAAVGHGAGKGPVKQPPALSSAEPGEESRDKGKERETSAAPSDLGPAEGNQASPAALNASPAGAKEVQQAPVKNSAPKSTSERSLPDLLGTPLSGSSHTQPSLNTFTADCDVLDRAVEAVGLELSASPPKKASSKAEPAVPDESRQDDKQEEPGDKGAKAPKHAAHEGQSSKMEASKGPQKPAERSLQQGETAEKAQGSAFAAEAAAEGKPCADAAKEERPAESKGPSESAAAAARALGKGQQKESSAMEMTGSEGTQGEGLPVKSEWKTTEGSIEHAHMSKEAEAEHVPGEEKPYSGDDKEPRAERRLKEAAVAEEAGSGGGKHPEVGSAADGAAAAGKDETAEARKAAALSDEQKVILERGTSLMHEANEHDPKGICLVRDMQAEVDKQDDMLDFSKTDAYRSTQRRSQEGQPGAPAGVGSRRDEAPAALDVDVKAEPSSAGGQQPEQAMDAEPSLQLVTDMTPDAERLDLSSAEVDTVAKITTEKPEQVERSMEKSEEGVPANEKKLQPQEPGQSDSQTAGGDSEWTGEGDTSDQHRQSKSERSPGQLTVESATKNKALDTKGTAERPAAEPAKPEAHSVPVTKQAEHQALQTESVSGDAEQERSAGGETRQQKDRGGEAPLAPGAVKQPPKEDALQHLKGVESVSASKPEEGEPNGIAKTPVQATPTDAGEPKSGTAPPSEAHAEGRSASKATAAPAAGLASGSTAGQAPGSPAAEAESAPGSMEADKDGAGQEDALGKALFDPLGMDAPDEALAAAPMVAPEEDAGGEAEVKPQNGTERDVELNLAVALRMIEERGNVAAAERTLQKQLAAVEESNEDVRPEFLQRLSGTLADVIARAAQQEAASGKHTHSQPDRTPEIIGLLQTAFDYAKKADTSSRSREGWRLGTTLMQAGKLDEAEALFKEEVKYSEEHLGMDSPNTQQSRAYLADALAKNGNKVEAYKMLSVASERLEQQAKVTSTSKRTDSTPDGADDGGTYTGMTPQAAATMSAAKCSVKLATLQDEEKDYEAAQASARRAVQLMEAAFGEGNPRSATAYGTLASILKHIGREEGLREAIQLYKRLQQITEDIHGLRNPQTPLALRSIADVHMMLKEYSDAVTCLDKARQIAASVHGRDHPIMASFWDALAEAKAAAGDQKGARDASRQALLVKSHSHRPGGALRSPREAAGARRGRGRHGHRR